MSPALPTRCAAVVLVALVIGLTITAGCGSDNEPAVTGAFITPPAGTSAALYFTVENPTNKAFRVTAVRTSLTKEVIIHGSKHANGTTTMIDLPDGVAVPARSKVRFAPDGTHVMLMGVAGLAAGRTVPVTVVLSDGREIDVKVPVRQITDDDITPE